MENATALNLESVTALLSRTPASLDALLRGLPEFWTRRNEGQDTWSAFDIVGHLIFADRTDWMPRLRRILNDGESVPFDPFDRLGQVRESQGKTLEQLLTEFAEVRDGCIKDLQALNLKPADFERRGKHPALGPVSASELLATWAVHDLNHMHQLSRVMAHQYGDAVGPFKAYLGVLHCNGHGA
jgi:DinB family protein